MRVCFLALAFLIPWLQAKKLAQASEQCDFRLLRHLVYHNCDLNQMLQVGEKYRAPALLIAACQSPKRVRPAVFMQALLDSKADPRVKDCHAAELRHFQVPVICFLLHDFFSFNSAL